MIQYANGRFHFYSVFWKQGENHFKSSRHPYIAAQYTADGDYQSSLIRNETDKISKETVTNAEALKLPYKSVS